ncbi:hypothetical protein L1987_53912 [Smallanthus sonchifolius]|uniref:Uncharacterized protein n=1 Tax=Smallanthus sonchifolius TaxID=185202 RepID=A0ACB9E563_9ASTR|nr:hypothetical protein L1987_53912 [Smallanthus sonchifolius]
MACATLKGSINPRYKVCRIGKSPRQRGRIWQKNLNYNSMGKENVATELNYTDNMTTDVEPCMGTGRGESCDEHVTKNSTAITKVQPDGLVQTNMEYAGDSILNSLSSLMGTGEAGNCNFSCQKDLSNVFKLNSDREHHSMVESLERWRECHKIQDHEVRRKFTSRDGKHKIWVDIDGTTGQEEEGPHWRIMKKHKGKKHSSKHNDHEKVSNQGNRAYNSEDVTGRKKHKIWSSKNRKPEKNMPTSRVHFQQSFNGTDNSNQPLGCSEFHMGSAKLGISFRNLKNFPAKINEEGEVNIDENMVEDEPILANDGEKLGGGWTNKHSPGNRGAEKHKPQAQNRDSGRYKEKGKGNEHVIVNVSNRNVVNNPRQQVFPEKPDEEVQMETPVVNNHTEINLATDSRPSGNKDINISGHTHETTHKKPTISVLETKNRFALLDEEGNEIMDMQGEIEEDNNMGEIPKELHKGWIRKQERVLNAKYYKDLTQDQRFEAKRYILDRLIPLDSTLSNDDGSHTDSHMEDVESEMDGNAVFMKSDGPAPKSHDTILTTVNSPEVRRARLGLVHKYISGGNWVRAGYILVGKLLAGKVLGGLCSKQKKGLAVGSLGYAFSRRCLAVYSKDTSFIEHVKKETPIESKFFEPPDPGDSKLQEEDMNDGGNETPCERMEENTPRLSSRLTRLIEEQGINRYRLRSGDGTDKGSFRHHSAKAKLMKPDRGRRNKQSVSVDKEIRPINMTTSSEANSLSDHVVGDAKLDDQLIAEVHMQSSLHGNVPGSEHITTTPTNRQGSDGVEEMQLGGQNSTSMIMKDNVTLNMEYEGDSILNNISIQSSGDEGLAEEEDQEVSSDQSTKHRSLMDMNNHKVSTCNLLVMNNIVGIFPGITHVWEQGTQILAHIIYPDKWEDSGSEEGRIEVWDVIVNRNKECLDNENYMGIEELRKHAICLEPGE